MCEDMHVMDSPHGLQISGTFIRLQTLYSILAGIQNATGQGPWPFYKHRPIIYSAVS